MRTPRSSLDLLAAIALALAGCAAVLVGLESWIRLVLIAPLALAVCGYAILAALLPTADLPPAERLAYAVVLSLAATTLGGVVAQLFLGLDRAAWAILLAAITVGAALVALRRRRQEDGGGVAAARAGRRSLALPGSISVVMIAAAVAVAVAAVAISSAGAKRERDRYRFTALWAQPVEAVAGSGQAVAIGVDNHQGATARYRLVVTQGVTKLVERRLVVPDGGRFRLRLRSAPISPSDPVSVVLKRNGVVFRHVYLENTTR